MTSLLTLAASRRLAGANHAHATTIFGGRSLMHAHNAYPENGQWRDRIERALATGATPVVIEQDIALRPATGASARTVVSHDDELDRH